MQDCSNSIGNTLELLQSCTKPSMCHRHWNLKISPLPVKHPQRIWATGSGELRITNLTTRKQSTTQTVSMFYDMFEFQNTRWLWIWEYIQCIKHITKYQVYLNPLRAKFFRGNINIYLHFVSFLHTDMTQVVEILPQIRQEPTYST